MSKKKKLSNDSNGMLMLVINTTHNPILHLLILAFLLSPPFLSVGLGEESLNLNVIPYYLQNSQKDKPNVRDDRYMYPFV